MSWVPSKVVSGGQTGVDETALLAANACGMLTGGWLPDGGETEDGPRPEGWMGLRCLEGASYATRTRRNVRDSDATLVLTRGAPGTGSALTVSVAHALGKPLCHLQHVGPEGVLSSTRAFERAREWLDATRPATLNIAGPRASSCPPGWLGSWVHIVLCRLFLQEEKAG